MNNLLTNPETAALIQGLKPHLGPQAASLADGMLAVINLTTSSVGRDVLKTIAQITSNINQKGTPLSLQAADGSLNIPFVMFLVFALLTFSENPAASSSKSQQKRRF